MGLFWWCSRMQMQVQRKKRKEISQVHTTKKCIWFKFARVKHDNIQQDAALVDVVCWETYLTIIMTNNKLVVSTTTFQCCCQLLSLCITSDCAVFGISYSPLDLVDCNFIVSLVHEAGSPRLPFLHLGQGSAFECSLTKYCRRSFGLLSFTNIS